MATFSFKLPDIGEGIAECEIAAWRVAVGDTVAEDQPLADMLTDKAAVEIPSPVAGVIKELRGAAGDKIAVGAVLMVIETGAVVAEADDDTGALSGQSEASTPEVRAAKVPDPFRGDENLVSPMAASSSPVAEAIKTTATGAGGYTFKLPDIGEGIAECEIAQWRVAAGDTVVEDQPLVDMLTDKAAVEIPSPVAGIVRELRGRAGDKIAVGAVLMVIETAAGATSAAGASSAPAPTPRSEGGTVAPTSAPATAAGAATASAAPLGDGLAIVATPSPAGPVATTPSAAATSTGTAASAGAPEPAPALRPAGTKALAAPSVRKRARELGIDLAHVAGSRKGGRVGHDDLDSHRTVATPSAAGTSASVTAPATGAAILVARATTTPTTSPSEPGTVEQIRIIGLRRKIAESMERSKRRIPHFAYVEEVDVTELEALRVHLNAGKRADQAKLTLLPFLMRALVKAVPLFPNVNGTYDDEAQVFHRHTALHIGIAAQTGNGLVVPVAKNAQALDLWASGAEVKRLADAAKAGKAKRDELSGSTITITSLGPMGGIASTPVINAPEVAIVGVNKMVERPMVKNGQIVVRTMMNLSSSFDHRIVDGWDAASFIQKVKSLLEHPATIFMP